MVRFVHIYISLGITGECGFRITSTWTVFTVMFTYNYEQLHLLINIDTDADRNMNVFLVRAQMSATP